MLISVIILTFNEEKTIDRCLDALVRSFASIEVIISDGRSSDQTLIKAKNHFPQATILENLDLKAPCRAVQMNMAVQYAKGDLFVFLHADTLLTEDSLRQIRILAEHQPSFWGAHHVRYDERGILFRLAERWSNFRLQTTKIAYGDQALFISRDLFFRIGGYQEIRFLEDVEICQRLKKQIPPTIIKKEVITSGRRQKEKGMIRNGITINLILILYFIFRIHPNRLERLYRDAIR